VKELIVAIIFALSMATSGGAATNALPVVDLEYAVHEVAGAHGVDGDLLWEMVLLESEGDPDAIGDDGAAVGLLQFHGRETYDTWAWLCCKYGHEEWIADDWRFDPEANATIGALAVADGYGKLWTSYRVLVCGQR